MLVGVGLGLANDGEEEFLALIEVLLLASDVAYEAESGELVLDGAPSCADAIAGDAGFFVTRGCQRVGLGHGLEEKNGFQHGVFEGAFQPLGGVDAFANLRDVVEFEQEAGCVRLGGGAVWGRETKEGGEDK